jgi:DNA-binding transcriptional regulator GbsR (MarR family)
MQEAIHSFVSLWGNMATHWGISRSMAQVYALLYAHNEPLDTDTIMHALDISRGNANINIRKLLEWGLITKADRPDSRRDLYTAEKDLRQLTYRIITERQKRELTPVSDQLKEIASGLEARHGGELSPEVQALHDRLVQMAEFTAVFTEVSNLLLPLLESADSQKIRNLLALLKTLIHPSHQEGV